MTSLDVLKKTLQPFYKYITIFTIIIVFLIISYLAIQYFKANYLNKEGLKKDIANMNTRKENQIATVIFFHVDWCPHCKTAKPEWDTFKTQLNDKTINNYTIKCIEYNCTDDKDSKIQALLNKYNIESYPTVKLLKDEQIIEFDSKITQNTLTSFVNVMLQ
tara:strand:+ start:845 stop:1327 length:483 start_codon:yes stop_codon:yes gene_type:complete